MAEQFSVYLGQGNGAPISYVLSPDRSQVSLRPTGTVAVFQVPENNGFALGRVYIPQIRINGDWYYLQPVDENQYMLSTEQPDSAFGFSLLSPGLLWQQPAPIDQLHFENFNPGPMASQFYFVSKGQTGQMVFSSMDNGGCPDLFTMVNGRCETIYGGTPFGLRSPNLVYTYKLNPTQTTAQVATTTPESIGDMMESPQVVRERYFFADGPFYVGGDYPIYTWVQGQKRYFSQPDLVSVNGPTVYQLTEQPDDSTARLTPTQPSNWGEYTLGLADFTNLVFDSTPQLALWDPNQTGMPAIMPQPTTQLGANASTPIPPVPVTLIPPFNVATGAVTIPTITAKPIWQQWWFWLLIILFLIALGVLLYFLLKPKHPSSVTIKTTPPPVKTSTVNFFPPGMTTRPFPMNNF